MSPLLVEKTANTDLRDPVTLTPVAERLTVDLSTILTTEIFRDRDRTKQLPGNVANILTMRLHRMY